MARKPTYQQVYDDLLSRYGVIVAEAFKAVVDDLRSRAEIERLVAAITAGDIEAALDALHIDAAAFSPLRDALIQAYGAGGAATAATLPTRNPLGETLVFRFDPSNPRAETWARVQSSDLITRITDDIRQTARETIVDGLQRGAAPRSTSLNIVGRINRATGKREGGILGLSGPQERAVRTARAELSSGEADSLRAFLGRERRDRRFDRTIEKAIREGKPLPKAQADKMITAYERRLLELRGQMIARTETLTSLNAAQQESLQQAVDTGKIAANQVRRVWKATGDARTRDTHAAMSGNSVGLNEAFTSPSGARLMFPGDPSAPASERISCRCWMMPRVDWAANLR